jgi:hypothetical protein
MGRKGSVRTEKVFIVYFSQSTKRPFIENSLNRHINWVEFDEIAEGIRPLADYKPVELIVDDPDATQCDYYICDGTHPVFSARAVSSLGDAAFKHFRLLPATLNGEPYFVLSRCLAEIDCFDRQNASYVECDPPEKLMFSIAKFAFLTHDIEPAHFFSIPESPYLLCTQVLADFIDRELKGFGLIEIFSANT